MLLYYLFWMFMGFIIHFYIIFGTNLLTQSPVPVSVFFVVSVFPGKGISNGVQTEWNLWERDFWNERDPEDLECKSRSNQGRHKDGGRAPPIGRAPCLVGPRWPSSTYPSTHLLPLSHKNPKNQLKHEFQPLLLWFSISLLKAPLTKLLGEIVPWYVTPPLVQLIFFLVLYSFQIFTA